MALTGDPAHPGHEPPVPIFTVHTDHSDRHFGTYQKKLPIRASRVEGPFVCYTIHGAPVRCEDGWLGIDSHGYPYPIDAEEFAAIYERVGDRHPLDEDD